jgi:hypothetical protein
VRGQVALREIANGARAGIYAVTVFGKGEDIERLGRALRVEGYVAVNFGHGRALPQPAALARNFAREPLPAGHFSPSSLYESLVEHTQIWKSAATSQERPNSVQQPIFNASRAMGSPYPNRGALYYQSPWERGSFGRIRQDRAVIYAYWDGGIGWRSPDSGVEIDFNVWSVGWRRHVYGPCYSTTNLPAGYDDCPTAGVSEDGAYRGYGFGSYFSFLIQKGYPYWGKIYLSSPDGLGIRTGTRFDWNVATTQTALSFCLNATNIWCRGTDGAATPLKQSWPDLTTGASAVYHW